MERVFEMLKSLHGLIKAPQNVSGLIDEAAKFGLAWADSHPISPWISVEDRLPEKHRKIKIKHGDADLDWISTEVFFMDDEGDCYVGMYDFGTDQWVINQDVFLYYNDVYDGGVITHWMPIPQLPKGDAA